MNLPQIRKRKGFELTLSLIAGLFGLTGLAIPSIAAAWTLDFPAGYACADFDLRIDGSNNPHQVYKEFHDKNGNVVRRLTAGKGAGLTFKNLSTDATLALKSNGAVDNVSVASDGTETHVSTGHNVLILFPTDIPAGPSTTLYVGRVIFTVDASQTTWTLLGSSGKSVDICAALSS